MIGLALACLLYYWAHEKVSLKQLAMLGSSPEAKDGQPSYREGTKFRMAWNKDLKGEIPDSNKRIDMMA